MESTRNFGRLVRERREQLNMTIQDTAELCGLSEKCLWKIELGDSDPKLSTVLLLVNALTLDIGDLKVCIPTEMTKNV